MTPRATTGFVAALGVAAVLGIGPFAGAARAEDTCLTCHRMQDEERLLAPTRHFSEDIHARLGLGCVGCHGGNPTDQDLTAMSPDKGFRGAPQRKDIVTMCTRCHSDATYMKRFKPQPYVFSLDEFHSSVHYKRMAAGDEKAATCTNCHGVHGILPISDPRAPVFPTNVPKTCAHCHNPGYMKGRALPTDQYEQYVQSVHGKALLEKGDLSAPACNDCHGNHGAVPPQVEDIAFVCGNCHGREGEMFGASKAKSALTLNGRRGCVTCHGNHGVQVPDDRMLSVGPDGLCGKCHQHGTAAQEMTSMFHALKDSLQSVDSLLALAERRGMEVTDGEQALRAARDKMFEARVAVHAFDKKVMGGILAEGGANLTRARARGIEALRDWRNRRVGMAGSLVVILLVVGVLLIRIRELERGSAAG